MTSLVSRWWFTRSSKGSEAGLRMVASCVRKRTGGSILRVWVTVFQEQRLKASLLKVVVAGERLLEILAFHDRKRNAIDKAPRFVISPSVQLGAGVKNFRICRNEFK